MKINDQLGKRLIVIGGIMLGAALIIWAVRAAILYTPTVEHNYADPLQGSADAPVKLVEYSDFQCPACKKFEPILKQAVTEFSSNISLEYNDFPLTQAHKNATVAAEAGQCALQQNKFWEYHDQLFQQQAEWQDLGDPTEKFVQYATDLSLDKDKFSACVNNHEQKPAVMEDVAEGNAKQVDSTPTLFVNGEEYDLKEGYNGKTGYPGLQELIKKYLPANTTPENTNVSNTNS